MKRFILMFLLVSQTAIADPIVGTGTIEVNKLPAMATIDLSAITNDTTAVCKRLDKIADALASISWQLQSIQERLIPAEKQPGVYQLPNMIPQPGLASWIQQFPAIQNLIQKEGGERW